MRGFVLAALLAAALPASAHTSDCSETTGVRKARCERHVVMYQKCGAVKGDAHFDCDREFLLANPLQCGAFSGDEAERCQKEVAAAKACEANAGRSFIKCLRNATGESPMGH